LDRAVELDPDDATSYDARGWNYRLSRKFEDAVADFDRAIDLEALDPSYRYRRGLVLLEKEELGRALEDFDEAIRLDPEEALYYYERARALLYHNPDVRLEDALPDLEEAIHLDPAAVWYRLDRGYIRFCMGRRADAAEDFACQDFRYMYQMCPYDGSDLIMWLYLARLFQGEEAAGLLAVKEYLHWFATGDDGGKYFKPLVSRFQDWSVPVARFLAGEIDEREFREAPSLDLKRPGLPSYRLPDIEERIMEYHFVIGELLLSQGRRDEALAHMKKASGLPAGNPRRWVIARQIT
jgi:tetratricopeptide (TPR) repeat protein